MPNDQQGRKYELATFDPRHFLSTCQKHGLNFREICRAIHKDEHVVELAIQKGQINPSWLRQLAKRFHMTVDDLRNPTPSAMLPIKIYISLPRERFLLDDAAVNYWYDHIREILETLYFKDLPTAYPDWENDYFEFIRPDFKNDKGEWEATHDVTSKSKRMIRQSDIVVFVPGWGFDTDCQIEHLLAIEYAKQMLYINDEPHSYLRRLGLEIPVAEENVDD